MIVAATVARPSRPAPRYAPVETVEIEDCRQQVSGACTGFHCPVCRKAFAGGAIVNDKPIFSYVYGQHVTYRRMYCDHCQHIVGWLHGCDARGERFFLPVSMPYANKTRKTVEGFLRAYPHAAGVSQS